MFGVDFSELVVILVVALIVVGPERLPSVARTLGHLWGRLQRYANSVKADISREMAVEELQQLQQKVNQEVMDAERAANQAAQALDRQVRQLDDAISPEGVTQQAQPEPELPPEAQKKFPID